MQGSAESYLWVLHPTDYFLQTILIIWGGFATNMLQDSASYYAQDALLFRHHTL